MTEQWTPVEAPFADPSNPDIAVKTPLWDGGPRPQNEVGGEPRVGMAPLVLDDVKSKVLSAMDHEIAEVKRLFSPSGLYVGDLRHQHSIAWDDQQGDFTKANWSAFTPNLVDVYELQAEYIPTRTERVRRWIATRLSDIADWLGDLAERVEG